MKQSRKTFLSLSLALGMLVSASACGSLNKTEPAPVLPEPVPELTVTVEPVKGWYLTAFAPIDYNRGNRFDFRCAAAGSYYVSREEILRTMDASGRERETVQMCLYRVDAAGRAKKLTKFQPLDLPSEHDGSFSMEAFGADSSGNLAVLEEEYRFWSDAPANVPKYSEPWYAQYNATEQYYLRRLGTDGGELSCAQLEDPTDSGFPLMKSLLLTDDGTALTLCSGIGVCAYDFEGKLLYTIPLDKEAAELVRLGAGYAVLFREEAGSRLQLLNMETRSAGQTCYLPAGAYAVCAGNGSEDFLYTDLADGCLYRGSWLGEREKLFRWLDCGVDGSFVEYCALQEDTVTCVSTLWRSGFRSCNSGIATVQRLPAEESGILPATLASLQADRGVLNFVAEFNRTLSGSSIILRDYSVYGNMALTRLRSDLMDSASPDMVELPELDRDSLVHSGLLEELSPWLAQSGISLAPCIADAVRKTGGLYGTCTDFTLHLTLAALPLDEEEPQKDAWTDRAETETVQAEPLTLELDIRSMEALYRLATVQQNLAGYTLRAAAVTLIPAEERFAMCAASREKEAAWQFLQRYFTADYQKEQVSTFPTNADLLEQQLQHYAEPRYELLDDGDVALDADGQPTERPFMTLVLEKDVELGLYALTDAQLAWIREIFAMAEPQAVEEQPSAADAGAEPGEQANPGGEAMTSAEAEVPALTPEEEACLRQIASLSEAIDSLLSAESH